MNETMNTKQQKETLNPPSVSVSLGRDSLKAQWAQSRRQRNLIKFLSEACRTRARGAAAPPRLFLKSIYLCPPFLKVEASWVANSLGTHGAHARSLSLPRGEPYSESKSVLRSTSRSQPGKTETFSFEACGYGHWDEWGIRSFDPPFLPSRIDVTRRGGARMGRPLAASPEGTCKDQTQKTKRPKQGPSKHD